MDCSAQDSEKEMKTLDKEGVAAHRERQLKEKEKYLPLYADNGLVFCAGIGKPVSPRNFARKLFNYFGGIACPPQMT